jgi:hypothetical protein
VTLVVSTPTRIGRPPSIIAVIALLLFLGVTALAGGIALVFGLGGGQIMLPDEWLETIPVIDSWLVPGLVLGIGFGVGSLLTAFGVIRQPDWGWTSFLESLTGQHWSWAATIALGAGHVLWIVLELLFLPEISWFHPLYGAVGLALLVIPFLPAAREHLRTR